MTICNNRNHMDTLNIFDMKRLTRRGIFILSLVLLISALLFPQNNRIEHIGKGIFLNGANVAWINFAHDIGNPDAPTDTAYFRKIFREIHDNGGNSMRLWLHTNGTATPEFSGNLVTGPGNRAISDLKSICDIAYNNDIGLILCLWSFDMQRIKDGGLPADILARNKNILTTDDGLNSYIENALIPMVDSLKEHPGIIAWEIFNEPEGMTEVGNWDITQHVSQQNVMKFINKCAGAIHRTDTTAKVTNGAWSFFAASDADGGTNYYSDARLIAAGGDTAGILDLYTVHYYDWDDTSPFLQPYSHWNLDKPLVIAEFFTNCKYCGTNNENNKTLYEYGYAGAMGWQYIEDQYRTGILNELQRTFDLYGNDIMPNDPHLPYLPSAFITSPENGVVFSSGDTVNIEVSAKKYNGSVVKVEFFEDGNKLGEDNTEPFSFKWIDAQDGFFKIQAKSTDNDGNFKTSSQVSIIVGEPPVYKYEAEDAILNGASGIVSGSTASGGKFVSMTDNNGKASITWIIPNCPADSTYELIIGYRTPNGSKAQNLYVNDSLVGDNLGFEGDNSTDWFEKKIPVALKAGQNSVKIVASWGWMDFDYLWVPFPKPAIVHVKSVEIRSENMVDYINEKEGELQLYAIVMPEDAIDTTINWSSDNTIIAIVSQQGLVHAKSDGVVTITAASNDKPTIKGTFVITVSSQVTGVIQSGTDQNVRIYPNPACDKLYIAGLDRINGLDILTIAGSKVLSKTIIEPETELDISALPPGIYLLKLCNEMEVINTSKLIIIRNQ
jgi:hypothetical protein